MTGALERPALTGRPPARLLWAIIALAAAVRLAAVDPFGMLHPDELFQYLEQAHRLATGHAIVPWEYRVGMRSWLVPALLAGPMWLGSHFDPSGNLDLLLPRWLVALAGLAPIWAGWRLGARVGQGSAIMAALVMAFWYECVGFSAHVLTEPLAAGAFLCGSALADGRAGRTAWRGAGAAFALAVVLRFHYAPAIGLYAALIAGRDAGRWRALALGALAMGAASAAVDLSMHQMPFGWMIENFRQNILVNRAAEFGVSDRLEFARLIARQWGWFALPIVALAVVAARRFPALAAAAIVNLLLHSLIGHKEYRFVWLSIETTLLLAAIGSAMVAGWLAARRPADARLASALVLGLWAVASVGLGRTRPMEQDRAHDRPVIALARTAGSIEGLCGLALHDVEYWAAGYAMVRQPVPIYYPSAYDPGDGNALARWSRAYNVILSPARRASVMPPAYRAVACTGDGDGRACLFQRPGGCDAQAARPVLLQYLLVRRGL